MTTVVLPFLFFLSCMFVVMGCLVRLQRRRIRCQLRNENVRSMFGQARGKLMELLREQELEATSETFRVFYHFQTQIMRRPDQYERLSLQLLKPAVEARRRSKKATAAAVGGEAASWGEGTKEVASLTAKALWTLIVTCSWQMRLAGFLERHLAFLSIQVVILGYLEKAVRSILRFLLWWAEKDKPEVREMYDARQDLLDLAHCT